PAGLTRYGFGLFPVRSPLLGESRLLSLPRGTKMFQFPRLPPWLAPGSLPITAVGLPHSGTSGSRHARCSPECFAVRRALLRLLAPRHPPVAHSSLTNSEEGQEPRSAGCCGLAPPSSLIPHPSSFP